RRQGEGDFDALLLGWLGNLDPFGFYEAQHRCEGANNAQGYCNPDVDQLLDQGRTETDQEQRKTFYDQAAEIIVDEVSYLYLYNPDVVHAWVPGLSGYETRPHRAIHVEAVQLADGTDDAPLCPTSARAVPGGAVRGQCAGLRRRPPGAGGSDPARAGNQIRPGNL